jgi:hypothetical protein
LGIKILPTCCDLLFAGKEFVFEFLSQVFT